MTLVNQNFDIYAGDTPALKLSINKPNGTPYNLTGVTVKWVVVRGKIQILYKETTNGGIVITDATNGKVSIPLQHEDTIDIVGSFFHEAVIIDLFGNVSTAFTGTLKVSPSFIK